MFKNKIHLYININWKEQKIEKIFENQDEFKSYIEKNPKIWLNQYKIQFIK
jgi:hypothetical protein